MSSQNRIQAPAPQGASMLPPAPCFARAATWLTPPKELTPPCKITSRCVLEHFREGKATLVYFGRPSLSEETGHSILVDTAKHYGNKIVIVLSDGEKFEPDEQYSRIDFVVSPIEECVRGARRDVDASTFFSSNRDLSREDISVAYIHELAPGNIVYLLYPCMVEPPIRFAESSDAYERSSLTPDEICPNLASLLPDLSPEDGEVV